jgi:hypothetical protein
MSTLSWKELAAGLEACGGLELSAEYDRGNRLAALTAYWGRNFQQMSRLEVGALPEGRAGIYLNAKLW